MNLHTASSSIHPSPMPAKPAQSRRRIGHQAAYNKLTRIGYYLATDLSRQTKRENMATLVLLDLAQQIVRLESKMAGNEVR